MSQYSSKFHLYTNIQKLCAERRLSIAELERAAGIGNGVIRKWDSACPTLRTFMAVAAVLGVTLEELLSGGGQTTDSICICR